MNAPAVAEDDELSLENAKNDWRETAAWWHRQMIPVADGMVKTPLNGRDRKWWRDHAQWHRDCLARLETCKVDGCDNRPDANRLCPKHHATS